MDGIIMVVFNYLYLIGFAGMLYNLVNCTYTASTKNAWDGFSLAIKWIGWGALYYALSKMTSYKSVVVVDKYIPASLYITLFILLCLAAIMILAGTACNRFVDSCEKKLQQWKMKDGEKHFLDGTFLEIGKGGVPVLAAGILLVISVILPGFIPCAGIASYMILIFLKSRDYKMGQGPRAIVLVLIAIALVAALYPVQYLVLRSGIVYVIGR